MLSSEKDIDYTRLRDLLKAGYWEEADAETANVIFEIANRKKEGWLRDEDMDNFPCKDLCTINQLWVDSSNDHFGFSVQKKIYQRIGVTREYNKGAWQRFGDTVGWRVNNKWIGQNCTFELTAPRGHLPVIGVWVESDTYHDDWSNNRYWYGWSLASRAWYSEVTGWHLEDVEDICHRRFSSFMSKLIKCNISA